MALGSMLGDIIQIGIHFLFMNGISGRKLADNGKTRDVFLLEFFLQFRQFRTVGRFRLYSAVTHVTGDIIRLVVQGQILR